MSYTFSIIIGNSLPAFAKQFDDINLGSTVTC